MATGGALIGALRVTLGLDSSEFEAGSARVRKVAKQNVNDIQAQYEKLGAAIGSNLRNALTGVAALLGGAQLVAAGKRALDYASSLGEVSQQLGVTSKDLQVYRYAASQVGISQDEMDTALSKLSVTIGKANAGVKASVDPFRQLGVSVKDANGNLLTAGQVIPRLADALAKVKDPATRAQLEVELFGRTGQKLDTLLAGGSSAINDLTKAATDLGLVISDKLINDADAAADKMSELKQVLDARFASAIAENAQAIYTIVEALEALITKAADAVTAWKRWRLEVGIRQQENTQNGWFSSQASKDQAAANINNLRGELMSMDAAKSGQQFHYDMKLKRFVPGAAPQAAVGSGALPVANDNGAAARKAAADAERARKEQLAADKQFNDQQARLNSQILSAKSDLTSDFIEQNTYEREQLDIERQADIRDIQLNDKLSDARKQQLIAETERLYGLKADVINRKENEQVSRDQLDIASAGRQDLNDLYQSQLSLSRTAKERRDLELKILEIQYDEEKARLEAVLASKTTTDTEKKIAQQRLDVLNQIHTNGMAAVDQRNQSPLQAYIDSIPKTGEELNEAFEKVAADGLDSLNDGLTQAIMGTKSLGEVFKNVANQIIASIIKIAIQESVIKPLASLLGGGGGGGGGFFGKLLGGAAKLLGGGGGLGGPSIGLGNTSFGVSPDFSGIGSLTADMPHFATGGSLRVKGNYGVDKNLVSFMASRGETVDIRRPGATNDNAGTKYFDLRGAVMTQDLLNQMNALASSASVNVVSYQKNRDARRAQRNLVRK